MSLPGLTDVLWPAFLLQTEMENELLCKHADQFSSSSVLGETVKLKVGKMSHLECPVSMSLLENLCDTHGWHVPFEDGCLQFSAEAGLVLFG